MTSFELNGAVVVVSGGGGRIGSAFIKAIAQSGGIGVIAEITQELADSAKERIVKELQESSTDSKIDYSLRIEALQMDITSKDSLLKAISHLRNKFGKIDAVVNNAYPRTANWGKADFWDLEYSDFCQNMNMQLGGYLLTSQQFGKFFKNQGFGNIISISSIQGVYAPKFDTYIGTNMRSPIEYSVIKAGVCHMTRYLAKYLANTGIRANAIAPGGILDAQPQSFLERYRAYCTSKGMLDTQDLCGSLIYLLSPASKCVNGQILVVDDGWGL